MGGENEGSDGKASITRGSSRSGQTQVVKQPMDRLQSGMR